MITPTSPVRMNFIDDVVSGRTALPTIPRVVHRLIAGLRRRDINLNDLALELARDPVLSSRVLRLANSSFYSGARSLASINDAVALVGTNALQTLVMACGVSSAFTEVPGVNLRQFWLDAVVTAATAQLFAQHLHADVHSAHAAGLLLGTGHLILCQAYPLAAAAEFTRYRNLRGQALAEREVAVFGAAHPAIGALWVDRLGFPREVARAITSSVDPGVGEDDSPLSDIVRVARDVAISVVEGDSAAKAIAKLDAGLLQRLALNDYVTTTAFVERYEQMKDLPAPT
ncbi:MAG: HDOD domain-containing protein [Burkholderiales bacterium]|nr:HDOD domain-containing protein [Burkholderiales bacterium]